MSPRRLDRAALRARLHGVEGWIVDDLADAFEGAAMTAQAKAHAVRKAASAAHTPEVHDD